MIYNNGMKKKTVKYTPNWWIPSDYMVLIDRLVMYNFGGDVKCDSEWIGPKRER